MSNFLKFSVDSVKLLDDIEKSLFRKIEIKAFATGENSHTLPIDKDVLERGAKTIYKKPILWKYDKYFDDAMGHEKDEVPCGFVPEPSETEDNPIKFVEENGKIYIVIYALIWTRYCGRILDIFRRDGLHKDVSIEIATIEDESVMSDKPKVTDFVVAGITILGEFINPACKGCEAELLEFSESQKEYYKTLDFENNAIEIDNSKDSATDGSWSNPRRKLFNPISKASNKRALLKEAYLIGDFDSEEPEITKFKYPHHVVRNNKLIIHISGIQAAFSRAKQQGIFSGDVKSHIQRHYRELGLSNENFANFGMSDEEFELYFADNFSNIERNGESSMALDKEKEQDMSTEAKKEEMAEEVKKEEMAKEESKEEKSVGFKKNEDDDPDDKEKEDKGNDDDDDDDDKSEQKMSMKMKEMSEKMEKLEKENKAYMSQIESMSDYNDLKKFKEDTEKEKVKQEEMAQMKQVMCDIEERGFKMSEDDKKEFMGKIREFSSVDAWKNYVKAQAFDRAEKLDDLVRMGLPYQTEKKSDSGSIWDQLD